MIHSKMIERLRMQYPPGTRIQLHEMNDPHAPVPSGTMGTVNFVDDGGNVHMRWDNGRAIALIPEADSFSVIAPALTPMKLYLPLCCDFYEANEYGQLEDYPYEISNWDACAYKDNILAAMIRYRSPEGAERGLMYWYQEDDSIKKKVHSAVFSVEERAEALWGTVECTMQGTLSPEEMDVFKDYITGQASDGWGERFEQRDIAVEGGNALSVHLWNPGKDWHIMTEEEFVQQHEQQYTPQMDGMQL